MRRHQFQPALSGREDARKDRRHSWLGEVYQFEGGSFHTNVVLCPVDQGCGTPPETIDPFCAKLVYLEAAQVLQKDRLQPTWGRVQQNEEAEYERIVQQALERAQLHLVKDNGNILEEFEGVLDKYAGDIAHVTFKTTSGETFIGEYPALDLRSRGVQEGRRFKCWTVEVGSGVEFRIEPIPENVISKEEENEIDTWIQKSLGDDDAHKDDY